MSQVIAETPVEAPEVIRKEFSITIDGVIDVPEDLDPKQFFDGLLDTVIEYIEQHKALAGISMSHKEYVEEDDIEASNGNQDAQVG